MITTAECQSPAGRAAQPISIADLPLTTFEVEDVSPARADVVHTFSTQLPDIVIVAALALAVAGFLRGLAVNSHRAIRATLTTTIVVLTACTVVGAGGWITLLHGRDLVEQGRYEEAMGWLAVARAPVQLLARHIDEWPEDPAGELREYAVVKAIHGALQRQQLDVALRIVEWESSSEEAQRARVVTFIAAAARALSTGDFAATAHYLSRAEEIDPAAAMEGRYVLATHLAFANLRSGELASAQSYSNSLPLDWRRDMQLRLASLLGRQTTMALLNGAGPSLQQAAADIGQAYSRAQSLGSIPLSLTCDWAAVLERRGAWALTNNQPTLAVEDLLEVESLVADAEYTTEVLPDAFYRRGVLQAEAGQLSEAIQSLDESLRRAPSAPAVVAQQAQMLLTQSWQLADAESFAVALAAAERSEALNPTVDSDEAIAGVHLLHAEHALRFGRSDVAWSELAAIGMRGSDDLRARAQTHATYMPIAQGRLKSLSPLARWATALPHVSGALCISSNNSSPCEEFALFDNGTLIGSMSAGGQLEVMFLGASEQQYSGARDSDGDGLLDVFIRHEYGREIHLIESDHDGHIDRQRTFVDGKLTEETLFSGRVLVRVLSAAIGGNQSFDPFGGRPDPYIVISHNQHVLGRSREVDNTFFPDWGEGWVIDYRRGDRLQMDLWDGDPADPDDYIDSLVLDRLPKSDVYRTVKSLAALELRVDETDLPTNYRYTGEAPGNVFLASTVAAGTVADIIAAANARESRARISAAALRILGAEAAAFILAPGRSLLGQLAVAFMGDMAVGHMVESRDER